MLAGFSPRRPWPGGGGGGEFAEFFGSAIGCVCGDERGPSVCDGEGAFSGAVANCRDDCILGVICEDSSSFGCREKWVACCAWYVAHAGDRSKSSS